MNNHSNKLIVVNLFGGPGAGKSTMAASVFANLKNRGFNVELVTEYAKELVYSSRTAEMKDQVYMLAKQHKRIADIAKYQKVPLVITDCPIMLGMAYSGHLSYYEELHALTVALANEFHNFNVFVKRTKAYNPSGRTQTEDEAKAVCEKVKAIGVDFDATIEGSPLGHIDLANMLAIQFRHNLEKTS